MTRFASLAVAAAVLSAAVTASLPSPAEALLICAKDNGLGQPKEKSKLFLKSICTPGKEVQVGTTDQLANTCPPDSVAVGKACVDTYESSVWSTTDAATIQAIRNGTVVSASELILATQHGAASDDYGAACPDTAAGCTDYYAVSISGVTPSNRITWFQAQAACRNSGKRLATNAEWQAAAYGTPDPGTDNGTTDCHVGGSPSGPPTPTGSRSSCVSDVGAFDMVGNLAEWVADWGDHANAGSADWTSQAGIPGGDASYFGGDGSGALDRLPAALIRGGEFGDGPAAGVFSVLAGKDPSSPGLEDGFRCAR